ncbi:hypothetical protein ACWEFL_14300 [Streptomyces sp. NPDC004838]
MTALTALTASVAETVLSARTVLCAPTVLVDQPARAPAAPAGAAVSSEEAGTVQTHVFHSPGRSRG